VGLQAQLATVRARILARIQAAVPAGTQVYDYLRRIEDEATLKAIANDTGSRLHFWQFGIDGDSPWEGKRLQAGDTRARVRWTLHGYYAVADASGSEKTFDAECAALFDAFEADPKLSTAGVPNTIDAGPAQRTTGGHVMLGGVLCHYARLSLVTVLNLG
jgi:hypothetical protein